VVTAGGADECPPSPRAVRRSDGSLLRDADDRRLRLDAGSDALDDGQALVDGVGEPRASLLEQGGDRDRSLAAADLLVVTKGEVDRPPRRKAAGEQALDRLERSRRGRLVVQSAASPDVALGHDAAKGRVGPARLGAGLDRNHVQMRHQQDGLEARIAPLPAIEEGVARDHLTAQRAVDAWIGPLQVGVEHAKRGTVEVPRILVRDRRELKGSREAHGRGPLVHLEGLRGRSLDLPRLQGQRADERDRGNQSESREGDSQSSPHCGSPPSG
jgi:hypothetical protein